MDQGFILQWRLGETRDVAVGEHSRRARGAQSGARAHPRFRRLDVKEHPFFEGFRAEDVHQIVKGTILLIRSLPERRRQIIDVIGPGRLFGLTAESRHRCSAVASVPTRVHSLSSRAAAADPILVERLQRGALAEIDR